MKFCRGQEGGGHISCLVSLCYLEAYALAPGQRLGAHPGLQREQGTRLSLCTLDVGLQTRTSPELGGHVLPLWCQARACLNLSRQTLSYLSSPSPHCFLSSQFSRASLPIL